jgi:hypothetical protein
MYVGKTVIQGILDRDFWQVCAQIASRATRDAFQNVVFKNLKSGSKFDTDDSIGCDKQTITSFTAL